MRSGVRRESDDRARLRRVIQGTAIAITGGLIATFLSLFARPCYLSGPPLPQQDLLDGATPADSVCRFGSPLRFIEEDRAEEVAFGDDSRTVYHALLGPRFAESQFDLTDASLDFGFWSVLLAMLILSSGPHLSRSKLKWSLRLALLITAVLVLYSRTPVSIAPGMRAKVDSIGGWPVGWFVAEGRLSAHRGTLLDPRAYNIFATALNVLVWWLALVFLASWRPDENSPGGPNWTELEPH